MAKEKKLHIPSDSSPIDTPVAAVVLGKRKQKPRHGPKKVKGPTRTLPEDEGTIQYVGDLPNQTDISSIILHKKTLAQRMGSIKSYPDNVTSGAFTMAIDKLISFGFGDLDSKISVATKKTEEEIIEQQELVQTFSDPSMPWEEMENKFVTIFDDFPTASSSGIQLPPLIPPLVAESVISRIISTGVILKKALGILLERGCICDASHPDLIETLLKLGESEIIFKYLHQAKTLEESTLVKVMRYVLASTGKNKELRVKKKFKGFDAKETALIALVHFSFNSKSMKMALKPLSLEETRYMLELLQRVLVIYSQTHAETLLLNHQKDIEDSLLMRLPSRDNLMKWVGVIIDSHYPNLLLEKDSLQKLKDVLKIIKEEEAICQQFLETKAIVSTMAFLSSALRKETRAENRRTKKVVSATGKQRVANLAKSLQNGVSEHSGKVEYTLESIVF